MKLRVDVYDAAGTTLLGDGPITTVTQWQNHRVLDEAGTFVFAMPASDPRAALLAERRIVKCYNSEDGAGWKLFASGIIQRIDIDTSSGTAMLTVEGQDMLAELGRISVRRMQVAELQWDSLTDGKGAVHRIWRQDPAPAPMSEDDLKEAYDGSLSSTTGGIDLDEDRYLYMGYDAMFDKVRLTLSDGNTSVATTLQAQYYNADKGWRMLTITGNTTITSGRPLAKTGEISWNRPDDWDRCTPTSAAGSWYWVRIYTVDLTGDFHISNTEVYADTETLTGPQLIMAKLPAEWGWSLDTVEGHDVTFKKAYMEFNDAQSVLAALKSLAEKTGEHFRLGEGKQVVWLQRDAATSPVRAIKEGDPIALEGNQDVCLISSVTKTVDAYDLMTRIIPFGNGPTGKRVTLALAYEPPPLGSGYTLDTVNNYIKSDGAEAAYGQIDRYVVFNDIIPLQERSHKISPKKASQFLCDAALQYLQRHDKPQTLYSLEVLQVGNPIKVGQALPVVYREIVDGYTVVDIDTFKAGADQLRVLGVSETLDSSGVVTTGVEVATVDRLPHDDTSTATAMFVDLLGYGYGPNTETTQVTSVIKSGACDLDSGTIDGIVIGGENPCTAVLTALTVAGDITVTGAVDGVDLSAHASDPAAHHDPVTAGTGISVVGQVVSLDLSGDLTLGNLIARDIMPQANDTYDLGAPDKLWASVWAGTMGAVLFTEATAQLLGGWFVVPKDSGNFAADVASGDVTIDLGKDIGALPQWILVRAHTVAGVADSEYIQVTSVSAGTVYNVTRDVTGTHLTDPAWPAGTPYLVLGAQGDGRIELDAYDTPRISVLLQGAAANGYTEPVRIGDLYGWDGVSSTRYGIGLGDFAGGNYLMYEPGAGFALKAGGGNLVIDADGLAVTCPDGTGVEYPYDLVTTQALIITSSQGTLVGTGGAYDDVNGRADAYVWTDGGINIYEPDTIPHYLWLAYSQADSYMGPFIRLERDGIFYCTRALDLPKRDEGPVIELPTPSQWAWYRGTSVGNYYPQLSDDFFWSPTGLDPKWTLTTTAMTGIGDPPSHFYAYFTGDQSCTLEQIFQPGTADFGFTVCFTYWVKVGANPRFQIWFRNATETAGVCFQVINDNTSGTVRFQSITRSSGTNTTQSNVAIEACGRQYVRVQRTGGSEWQAWWSPDGYAWRKMADATLSNTTSIDHVEFVLDQNGVTLDQTVLIDFIHCDYTPPAG